MGQHVPPVVGTVPGGQQRAFLPLPKPRSGGQHVPFAQTVFPLQQTSPQQSTAGQQVRFPSDPPQLTFPFGQHIPFEQCSPADVLQQSDPHSFVCGGQAHFPLRHN